MNQPASSASHIPADHPAFDAFVATIAALRAPDGCPWDREQTHASIASNMIEEAYEAVDAIDANDTAHLREELGDVLLQVVLQCQIAADNQEFTIDDVCADINEKMIRRHPHVFGEAQASSASEVLDLWDQVKLSEKAAVDMQATEQASTAKASDGLDAQKQQSGLLDGVPTSFPALMQAQKVSRKAAAVGFEWQHLDDVWTKVAEEITELKNAYAAAPHNAQGKLDSAYAPSDMDASSADTAIAAVRMEFGDVLFALVNVARKMGIDAEGALRDSCNKFRSRWAFMEGAVWAQGRTMQDCSAEELEALWEQAKAREHV